MLRVILFLGSLLSLTACISTNNHVDVSMSDVPSNVLLAAKKAVVGLNIESIGMETQNSMKVYEFAGTKVGVKYEIAVSESGDVLSVEKSYLAADKSESTFSG